jgi:hypothetical protein
MKLFQYLQGLLAIWVIYFVVIGIAMLFILFIGIPIVLLITNKQLAFPPSLAMIYKAVKFTVFAAIFSGTIVWIKEVVFQKSTNNKQQK